MKKLHLISILILCCYVCLLFCTNNFVYAQQTLISKPDEYNVLILGDSVAAGFVPDSLSGESFYTDYQNYLSDTTPYTYNSFGDIFSQRYYSLFGSANTSVVSKAVNGFNTTQLLALINSGNINDELADADAIVLSIGANNILGPMLNNLSEYLADNISLETLETYIDNGVNTFYTDIDAIISKCLLANSQIRIYPMTMYYPFKYADLTEITILVDGTDITSSVASYLSTLNTKLQALNAKAMEGLDEINNYIIANEYNGVNQDNNITPIDICFEFNKLTKEEYPTYLNTDTSTMIVSLTQSQAISIMMGNYTILNQMLINNSHLDPHPTIEGHNKIGQIYKENIHDIFINADKTLIAQVDDINNFVVTYQHIGEDNLVFYLEKISNTIQTQIQQLTSNSLQLDASSFIGNGKLIVVGYDNTTNEQVCTSNSLNYNIIENQVMERIILTYSGITSGNISEITSITLNYSYTSNYIPSIRIYKNVAGVETLLTASWTNNSVTLDTIDLVGSDVKLYMKTFNNDEILATSNSITVNFEKTIIPTENDNSQSVFLIIFFSVLAVTLFVNVFFVIKYIIRKNFN